MKLLGTYLDGRLVVVQGDITGFKGGAIVNAANSGLLGGGGVDEAIHDAAGPALLAECRALRSGALKAGLPAGKAVATGPGRLGVRRVIHTVGPIWRGGASGEAGLLASCYGECLKIARTEGLEALAFPAISTGVYGYPKREAALVAYGTVAAFLAENPMPQSVTLVFYTLGDARAFFEALGESRPLADRDSLTERP